MPSLKFNSSHLKNDGWKTTLLLGWYICRGYVKLPKGNGNSTGSPSKSFNGNP